MVNFKVHLSQHRFAIKTENDHYPETSSNNFQTIGGTRYFGSSKMTFWTSSEPAALVGTCNGEDTEAGTVIQILEVIHRLEDRRVRGRRVRQGWILADFYLIAGCENMWK